MKKGLKHVLVLIPKMRRDAVVQGYWFYKGDKTKKKLLKDKEEFTPHKLGKEHDIKRESVEKKLKNNEPLDALDIFYLGDKYRGAAYPRPLDNILRLLKNSAQGLFTSFTAYVSSSLGWGKRGEKDTPTFKYKVNLGNDKSRILSKMLPVYAHRLHKGGAILDSEVDEIAEAMVESIYREEFSFRDKHTRIPAKEGETAIPDIILAPPITIKHPLHPDPEHRRESEDLGQLTVSEIKDINTSFAHRLAKSMADQIVKPVNCTDSLIKLMNKKDLKNKSYTYLDKFIHDEDFDVLLGAAESKEDLEEISKTYDLSLDTVQKLKDHWNDIKKQKTEFERVMQYKKADLLTPQADFELYHDIVSAVAGEKNQKFMKSVFDYKDSDRLLEFKPYSDPLLLGHKPFQVKNIRGYTPRYYAENEHFLNLGKDVDLHKAGLYLEGDEELEKQIHDYEIEHYGKERKNGTVDAIMRTTDSYLLYRYWFNNHVFPRITGKPPAKSVKEFNERMQEVFNGGKNIWLVDDNIDAGSTGAALSFMFNQAGYNLTVTSPFNFKGAMVGANNDTAKKLKKVGQMIYDKIDPEERRQLLPEGKPAKLKPTAIQKKY